jgi:hypothetical protein
MRVRDLTKKRLGQQSIKIALPNGNEMAAHVITDFEGKSRYEIRFTSWARHYTGQVIPNTFYFGYDTVRELQKAWADETRIKK